MADGLDLDAMLARFQARAESVKQRQIPPVEGEARRAFVEQSKLDYQDFAIIANSDAELVDGVLTFRIDLRPKG
ncbi:MAG: hypothetical protein M9952_07440 [Microthrixaceae bacterium]|nr:hypothetical protein [Microthrixaceae bacterium]MCO5312755.1 hypothetical protein [Microthrixaceae bacterium]HPB45639.1 hypothetical protein [Microthrixaceae bacterium]